MVNSKNSLNLSSKNKTNDAFNKSTSLRPQVDGIIKKRKDKISITHKTLSESLPLNKENIKEEAKVEKIPEVIAQTIPETETNIDIEKSSVDDSKRLFFKVAGVAGLGLAASALFPKSSEAYVSGSTPTSNVVGLRDSTNLRINPSTVEGQGVSKFSIPLSSSGIVLSPSTSSKKIRVYATRFSLTADADSVSFRFTSGGDDHEKYVSPKTGGLYGANNHPNYIEGGVNDALYCMITGTTTVQINIDYLEV